MARRGLRLAWLIAGLLACAPAGAQTVTLTPEQMRAEAMSASQAGRHDLAAEMAAALLRRDPNDFAARLVASRVARDRGDAKTALAEALAASKLAQSRADQYSAALLVAQALSTAGRRTEAQLWLRWAGNLAPNDRARAIAMRDFRYVRSRNPLKLSFSLNAAPSNNINNGSSADLVTIWGFPAILSGDAMALSGTRYSAQADLVWRFPATESRRAQAELAFHHQTHSLSNAAKSQAPNVSATDYDYSTIEASFRQVLNFGPGAGLWGWDVAAGRSWYGRDPLSDFYEIGLDRTLRWDGIGTVTIAGDLRHQRYVDGSGVNATAAGLSAALDRKLASGARLRLELGVVDSMSDEANVDYMAYRLDAGLRLAKPVAGALMTLSAGLELKEYPFSIYTPLPGRREDVSRRVSAEFLFPEAQAWGFAPSLTAEYNLRESNADRYDTETFSVELGIRSVF